VYWLGLVAAAAAMADAILYPYLIGQEDTPNDWSTVAVITSIIALGAVLAAAGSLANGNSRALLLWPATAILLPVGFLALFSIGLPLVLAGIVTFSGALTATRGRRPSPPPARRPRSASSRP
jgi:low temperature requirement protein LtrA